MADQNSISFDYMPLTLSIETVGGVATDVIKRGTPLPCTRTNRFSTVEDDQESITLQFGLGEAKLSKNNYELPSFEFKDLPKGKKGSLNILAEIQIDKHLSIAIDCLEKNSSAKSYQTINVSNDFLSEEAISKAISKAQALHDQESSEITAIELRRKAKNLISTAEGKINSESLQDRFRDQLIDGVASLGVALQSDQDSVISQRCNELTAMLSSIQNDFSQMFGNMFANYDTNKQKVSENKQENTKPPDATAQTSEKEKAIMSTHKKKIFIGHGRSGLWRELKDFLVDRLQLDWDEFSRDAPEGLTTVQRLEEMLKSSDFAFLIMTAEDATPDGRVQARQNVIHEIGLFQGRLGFRRAIVLLEDGCEEFSNIHGLTQIRFPKSNISAAFENIRRVLEREKIVR